MSLQAPSRNTQFDMGEGVGKAGTSTLNSSIFLPSDKIMHPLLLEKIILNILTMLKRKNCLYG